jgi:hypothetical protein
MNEKQQLSMIEDLENFAFEIARLCRSGFPIGVQDMAIIQLCHRELDRISEQMIEDEDEWNKMKQHEAEENRRLDLDAMESIRSAFR